MRGLATSNASSGPTISSTAATNARTGNLERVAGDDEREVRQ